MRALYSFTDEKGVVQMLLMSHVDDLLWACDQSCDWIVKEIIDEFKCGTVESDSFRLTRLGVSAEIPTPPANWVNVAEDDKSVLAAERKTTVMRVQNRLQQSFAKLLKPGQGVWEWSFESDTAERQGYCPGCVGSVSRSLKLARWWKNTLIPWRRTCPLMPRDTRPKVCGRERQLNCPLRYLCARRTDLPLFPLWEKLGYEKRGYEVLHGQSVESILSPLGSGGPRLSCKARSFVENVAAACHRFSPSHVEA
eukprot:s5577_g2.t1